MLEEILSASPVIGDVTHIPDLPGSVLINSFLSPYECSSLIENIYYEEYIDTTFYKDEHQLDIQRISHRLMKDVPEFASQIFERLSPFLPQTFSVPIEDEFLGPFSKGTWLLKEAHDRISFLKYDVGGKFSLHRDVIFMKNENLRSFYTVLIYLNENYEGGNTIIYNENREVLYEIVPKTGLAFVMPKRQMHEGCEVMHGTKHVLRVDVLYERDGELDKSEYSNREIAMKYVKLAANFEKTGYATKAIEYYKKAFKLDPSLEDTA